MSRYPRPCDCAYLVAQALAGNDSNLIADALVGLEVESEARVVALDDDLGRLLDRLSPDATHFDRCELLGLVEDVGGGDLREVGGEQPVLLCNPVARKFGIAPSLEIGQPTEAEGASRLPEAPMLDFLSAYRCWHLFDIRYY